MSIAVKNTTSVAIEEEVTEGTYVTPSGAGSFLQVLESGLDLKGTKALLKRQVFAGTIGEVPARTGERTVSGQIPVEMRAFSTQGHAPEYNSLMKSALGSRRQNTTVVTTKSSGNTGSVLQIADSDIAKFAVGDIIVVQESGAYWVSPITAVDTTSTAANITLLVPRGSSTFPNSVTIGKFTTYLPAESGHPTLSISKYIDSAILEKAYGCRVNKMSLKNFMTGKIPSFDFGFEGLNFDRTVTAPSYVPTYDTAFPPIVLDGRMYQDGSSLVVNEFSFSLEQTIGFSTSIASANGKVSSRITSRKIIGTLDPYQQTDDVNQFTKFANNTLFSIFAYGKVDTGTAGQFGNIVAFYMPNCLITDITETDSQGLVVQKIAFEANRGPAGTTNEIYVGII